MVIKDDYCNQFRTFIWSLIRLFSSVPFGMVYEVPKASSCRRYRNRVQTATSAGHGRIAGDYHGNGSHAGPCTFAGKLFASVLYSGCYQASEGANREEAVRAVPGYQEVALGWASMEPVLLCGIRERPVCRTSQTIHQRTKNYGMR